MHTNMLAYIHAYILKYIHKCIQTCRHTYIQTCIHMPAYVYGIGPPVGSPDLNTETCQRMLFNPGYLRCDLHLSTQPLNHTYIHSFLMAYRTLYAPDIFCPSNSLFSTAQVHSDWFSHRISCLHTHIYIQYIHTYIHTYICSYIHTYMQDSCTVWLHEDYSKRVSCNTVCTSFPGLKCLAAVRTYVRMYVCIHLNVCMYVCLSTCVCIYVCMFVCFSLIRCMV